MSGHSTEGREDLDRVLEACLEDLDAGASVEDCLARYPNAAAALEGPLRAAADLRVALDVEPRRERMAAGRARVLAEAARVRNARFSWSRRWLRPRGVLAPLTAGFLAVAMMGALTVSASAHAVPGDTLYPLKLVTERVRYAVTLDDGDRAALHVKYANRRLAEIQEVAAGGRPVEASLLNGLADELERAVDARDRGRLRDADVEALERLGLSLEDLLDSLGERLPEDGAARLRAMVRRIGSRGPNDGGPSERGSVDGPNDRKSEEAEEDGSSATPSEGFDRDEDELHDDDEASDTREAEDGEVEDEPSQEPSGDDDVTEPTATPTQAAEAPESFEEESTGDTSEEVDSSEPEG